jgi:hypothetical protein
MTIEQENAINLIQKLIDYNAINGEQATTLMLGVMSSNFNIPVVDDTPYEPIKVYYSKQPTIDEVKRDYITEPLPSYTVSTTGVNEMINKITDKN